MPTAQAQLLTLARNNGLASLGQYAGSGAGGPGSQSLFEKNYSY